MDLDLFNKTVFITGASTGIGAAEAQIFSEEGANMVISFEKDADGAENTARQVRANGRRAWLCPEDVNGGGELRQTVLWFLSFFYGWMCICHLKMKMI